MTNHNYTSVFKVFSTKFQKSDKLLISCLIVNFYNEIIKIIFSKYSLYKSVKIFCDLVNLYNTINISVNLSTHLAIHEAVLVFQLTIMLSMNGFR